MAIWRRDECWISKAAHAHAQASSHAATPTHTHERARAHAQARTRTHAQKYAIAYLLLVHGNNGSVNAPEWQVLCALPVLCFRKITKCDY